MQTTFRWLVVSSGYRWSQRVNAETQLTESVLEPIDWLSEREYAPLEEFTGLFRVFAEVDPTPEGILEFANQYGQLGFDVILPSAIDMMAGIYNTTQILADSLELWQSQLGQMKLAVRWWDAVRPGGDLAQLSESDRRGVPEWINVQMRKWVPLQFRPDSQRGGMSLQVVPTNLIGALWLQFAQAFSDNTQHRRCGTCGRWFALSPETARTNRLFCSDACRSRAYRERKVKAQELHKAGKSPDEIAEALGSTTNVIIRWLKENAV